MNASIGTHIRFALYGLILGFALSRIGFSDFDEVHKMFTFTDLRLFLAFMLGVGLTFVGLRIVARGHTLPPKPLHRGTIIGGVLFGVGWAVTGACPGVALVQIGEGRLPAFATLGGILLGAALYPFLHARYFRWDTGSCEM